MRGTHSAALAAAAFGLFVTTTSEAMDLGEFEYRNSCVQCHGVSGKGDGSVAELLKVMPSDLTQLQKNNGGVFPVKSVYSIIDGSDVVAAHGDRDMPLWGDRYRSRISPETDPEFSPEDTEAYVRIRILSLIEYLAGLQVE